MNIFDRISQWLSLSESWIIPIISICLGFKNQSDNKWNGWIKFGHKADQSLFYNGIFFFRLMLPFFIGFGIRWSGSTTNRAFLQTYIGWKSNGYFSIVFRIQSDQSAAIGYTHPNVGQAQGWMEGTK